MLDVIYILYLIYDVIGKRNKWFQTNTIDNNITSLYTCQLTAKSDSQIFTAAN